MEDIVPGLLEAIKKTFTEEIKKNSQLAYLGNQLDRGGNHQLLIEYMLMN